MSDRTLSAPQRRIVEHPPNAGHLLVRAGPGAGKTRTIVERIHLLLEKGHCSAEHILAMTFTLNAASELRDRLARQGHAGVTAGTFHHVCARLLGDHGGSIGIPPPVRISDLHQREALLLAATTSLGLTLEKRGPLSVHDLGVAISRRKLAGLLPEDSQYPDLDPRTADTIRAVDTAYTSFLRDRATLDFDDLLLHGIELLRTDPDTARTVRSRYRFVFVDEFHDLSPDQFTFLREVAPPFRPQGEPDGLPVQPFAQVMAVADENQSIFGFRDAHPSRIIPAFIRAYRPVQRSLSENYRSTATIVGAAGTLRDVHIGQTSGPPLVAMGEPGQPISCIACHDEAHEAATLVSQIGKALASKKFGLDDIAVLYRTHARANVAEAALLAADLPIRRIQPRRFFDQPDVQESLRYLDLAAAIHDDGFAPALNWPRVLVDEPTMIHLRRLAHARGQSLAELAQDIDALGDAITPLTRATVSSFLTGIAAALQPIADGPLPAIIDRLLVLLDGRRSPIPTTERETLFGLLAFLSAPLAPAIAALKTAIASGQPVALRHAGDPDTIAAAVILEYTFSHYLRHPVTIGSPDASPDPTVLMIDLQFSARCSHATGLTLAPFVTRDRTYPVALLAWRLGQLLLMSFETLDEGQFTIYDLETGDNQANTAEILEIAALRVASSAPTGDMFSSLVRPSHQRAITYDAAQVHGIGWSDVADAPSPQEILPGFLAFLGDDTLVGHGIDTFDGRILRRLSREIALPPPTERSIDTAALARRLLPGRSHTLEVLAQELGILKPGERQPHRALPDCALVAALFPRLLARSRLERELDALDETLPLVALAITAAGDDRDELATLSLAGARGLALGQGADLLDRWRDLQTNSIAATTAVAALRAFDPSVPADDAHWSDFARAWRETVAAYLATGNESTLPAFLHYVRLATSLDATAAAPGRVTLMTIHSAKGKEWPLVFVIGAEDGAIPLWHATDDDALAEERRVLYVALTRARTQVRLLWAASGIHGHTRTRSRFLAALPPELIRHTIAPPTDG